MPSLLGNQILKSQILLAPKSKSAWANLSYLGFNDMPDLGILFSYYICELLYCTVYMSWINFIIILQKC